MWVDPPGYFCREPDLRDVRFAFTNHGVSVGLQAVGVNPERVSAVQRYFVTYRSNDEYDRNAITHVMACSSLFPGRLIQRGRRVTGDPGTLQPAGGFMAVCSSLMRRATCHQARLGADPRPELGVSEGVHMNALSDPDLVKSMPAWPMACPRSKAFIPYAAPPFGANRLRPPRAGRAVERRARHPHLGPTPSTFERVLDEPTYRSRRSWLAGGVAGSRQPAA